MIHIAYKMGLSRVIFYVVSESSTLIQDHIDTLPEKKYLMTCEVEGSLSPEYGFVVFEKYQSEILPFGVFPDFAEAASFVNQHPNKSTLLMSKVHAI